MKPCIHVASQRSGKPPQFDDSQQMARVEAVVEPGGGAAAGAAIAFIVGLGVGVVTYVILDAALPAVDPTR